MKKKILIKFFNLKKFFFLVSKKLNIPEEKTKIIEKYQIGHYVRTPYAHQTKFTKKLVPNKYVDIGEGILQIINELKQTES